MMDCRVKPGNDCFMTRYFVPFVEAGISFAAGAASFVTGVASGFLALCKSATAFCNAMIAAVCASFDRRKRIELLVLIRFHLVDRLDQKIDVALQA